MTWHSNWSAYVDGARQPVVMLSPGFSGVALAPGRHHIEFRYEPGPWKPLLRAIACFYRREDDACERNLAAIDPASAPARLAPVLRAMLAGTGGQKLNAAARELVSRAAGDMEPLRQSLRKSSTAALGGSGLGAASGLGGQVYSLVRVAGWLGDDELRKVARLRLEGASLEEIAAQVGVVSRSIKRKLAVIRAVWERELNS